jgi:protein disulfide-isomerase-like protein
VRPALSALSRFACSARSPRVSLRTWLPHACALHWLCSYAPWCGHCKTLKPEYEEVAKQLAEHDPPIPVAAVDATVSKAIAKRYDVTGYPTVFAFRGTTAVHYDDEKKNTKDMVQFMRDEHPARVMSAGLNYQGPTNLPSKQHLKKFLDIKAFTVPAVIAFIPEEDAESTALSEFQMVHYGLREKFAFGIVRASAAMTEVGATAGEVRVYKAGAYFSKKFEQRHYSIPGGSHGVNWLKEEILSNCLPLVGEMHADSQEFYLFVRHHSEGHSSAAASASAATAKPLLLVYTNVNFDHKEGRYYKETRNLAKLVRGIVAPFHGQMHVAIGDKTAAAKSLEALGFPTGADKIATIQNGTMKYKFVGASTAHFKTRLSEFVGGFLEGNLEPFYRTAEAPCCTLQEALTEGHYRNPDSSAGEALQPQMLELIGKTARNLVFGSPKDTMIEIYAPGCPHCSALKPHWKELSSFINEHKELQEAVQLAVVDGARNDVPINGISIPGFPAIFYVPGNYSGAADRIPVHIDLASHPSGYGKVTSSLLQALADQPRIQNSESLRALVQERLAATLQAEAAAAEEEARILVDESDSEDKSDLEEVLLHDDEL